MNMKKCYDYCYNKCQTTMREIGAAWVVAIVILGLMVLAGAAGIL